MIRWIIDGTISDTPPTPKQKAAFKKRALAERRRMDAWFAFVEDLARVEEIKKCPKKLARAREMAKLSDQFVAAVTARYGGVAL